MAATFLGTIVKFEEDGVWLSPIVNGSKLHSPTDMVRNEDGKFIEIPARNVVFNEKGEFKLPYKSPRVLTSVIPTYKRNDDYIGKFCLYIAGIFDNPNKPDEEQYGMEFIAVEVGDDAFELSSKWH